MNIKKKRIELGFKVKDIAKLSGIAVSSLYYYEAGEKEPSYSVLKKIASALGCSIFDLDSELTPRLANHFDELENNLKVSNDVRDLLIPDEITAKIIQKLGDMDIVGKAKMLAYASRIEETVAGGVVPEEPNLENEKQAVS